MGAEMARAPSNTPRRTRLKAEPAPTTPDPIEIAMEAEASGETPRGVAHEVLRKQSELIGWEIADRRAAFVLKLLTAIAGLAVAAAVAAMAWSASQADGLVVEPFLLPAALADRGMTGAVVARGVLDRLAQLDRDTDSFRPLRLSDGWSQTASIPIARTGVSVDDVDRLLKRWLGRQTFVSGEVVLQGDRAVLTARIGAGRTVTVEGVTQDLSELGVQAAEALFARARPLQYSYMLNRMGRYDDAIASYDAFLASGASADDRATAHTGKALSRVLQGRWREALAQGTAALEAGPAPPRRPYRNLMFIQQRLGMSEPALRNAQLWQKQPFRREVPTDARRLIGMQRRALLLTMEGDYLAALRAGEPMFGMKIPGSLDADQRHQLVPILVGLHEPGRARRLVPLIQPGSPDAARRARIQADALMAIATEEGDWPVLLTLEGEGGVLTGRAIALARLGRLAEAQALADSFPPDCDVCLRARGEIAEAAGHPADADRWFAEAARITPSLPFALTDWGRIKLARGDVAGAIAAFTAAHAKPPRFADPLAYWGEALLAQGDAKNAVAKFAEAAKLAPRWGRLHLKWGEALAKLGKADEARAKWRAAAGMDLSAADRAALKAHGV